MRLITAILFTLALWVPLEGLAADGDPVDRSSRRALFYLCDSDVDAGSCSWFTLGATLRSVNVVLFEETGCTEWTATIEERVDANGAVVDLDVITQGATEGVSYTAGMLGGNQIRVTIDTETGCTDLSFTVELIRN